MSGIARTSATGGGGMLPELLAWSSSFAHDRALVREDLVGSAAHVTMLARTGLVSPEDATALRSALFALLDQARHPRIERPSTRTSGIPAALDDVVMRALAPAPEDRPQTAAEFRRLLLDAVPGARQSRAMTWRRCCAA